MNDGGPAFPAICDDVRDRSTYENLGLTGMSLRDYFAGQALTAMVGETMRPIIDSGADVENEIMVLLVNKISEASYEFADAMLRERTKEE